MGSMDQTKQSMEKEVKQLKEDHERKELDIQRIKRDLQDLNLKVEEFKARQEDMKELGVLKDQIRCNETNLQQLQLDKQETSATIESITAELQAFHSDLRSREAEMAREASLWAEIKDYTQELETVRKGKTDAEIVAADLEQEIAKFSSRLESLEKEEKSHREKKASEIRGMLEAYKKFEAEVKEELDSKMMPAFKNRFNH